VRYEGIIYRPPSEAGSLLIQATVGCPHNRCSFCAMYKTKRFRIRPMDEIKADILKAREVYGDEIKTMFFPDGNTIFMKTSHLVEMFSFARKTFPGLERITVYGSAKFLALKSLDEFSLLAAAGLSRIHAGMESGDDQILSRICKGADSEATIKAGLRVKQAGIQLSEYVLVGIGGKERSPEHALNTAKALNAIGPDFIRFRTYVPQPGTPLFEDYESGRFHLLAPHEALREMKMLIEALETPSLLFSDHVSNYWDVHGRLPQDKERMLQSLDVALSLNESWLRPHVVGIL